MTEPTQPETTMTDWPDGDPAQACLVLDFDGTLAPIVADPATSRMPEETRDVLVRLAGVLGRLAIVSGRPAGFLADRVDVDGAVLVGLYGLEQVVDGVVVPDPRVAAHEPALAGARQRLGSAVAEWPGAELEDKGRALALHWRRAEDREGAAEALTAAAEEAAGDLEVEHGKMVIELRPAVPADKGTAVTTVAEGFTQVAYAGDDLGDLPAFATVRERGGVAVAVDHGEETDPRMLAAADVVVSGTDGMAQWLRALADRLGA